MEEKVPSTIKMHLSIFPVRCHACWEGSANRQHLMQYLVVSISAEKKPICSHLIKCCTSTLHINRCAKLLTQDDLRSPVESRHHVLVRNILNLGQRQCVAEITELD